jgi:hypothetical protein
MLLRIPPASLQTLKQYAAALDAMGINVESVVTRVSFDPATEYPALQFRPMAPVADEHIPLVEELMNSEAVTRILNTAPDQVAPEANVPGPAVVTPAVTAAPQPTAMQPAPAPAAPNPVQASAERVAEVEQKVGGDPQREALRKLGLTEEQITAALGPEPKEPEPEPEDPRIAGMRALGLTDEQIHKALGITPEVKPEPKKATRGRTKKEEPTAAPEQEKPADVKADEPKPGELPADFEAALASMLGPTQTPN